MIKHFSIKINGKICEVHSGQSLIEALKLQEEFLPTLCYTPELKAPLGTCRVCLVQDRGCFVAGCTLKVEEGMEIETQTEELQLLRKSVIDMLFVEGNHFCPACEKSGDCELQALAYRFQIMVPQYPYSFPQREVDYSSSKIVLERNRCILCKRCVQEIRTEDEKPVFGFTSRGSRTTISMEHEAVEQLSEAQIDKAVSLCPVGAILKKAKGFDRPYGTRKYDQNPIH
jgi:NADH dehydrogenase/NADH:ubiquinone oxidoreductase subunit G